jgi:diguanylate cyclase (GGDEF)-like protein
MPYQVRQLIKDSENEAKGLRLQLEEFMVQARQNERKLRRFQALELRLIGLNSLFELINAIIYPDYSTFKWDVVTLLLLDPEYELQRILEEEGIDLQQHPALMFATTREDLESLYPLSLFPTLGPYKAKKHEVLFPSRKRSPSTIALLPLVRHGKLIGSLNVGSNSGERFVRGVRTDFFEHLAAVVAICLENASNLERLKRQGLTDTLTAINNRRFFDQRLSEEIEESKRNATPLSCMLLDVDHFKQVNDTYGHQVGDQVLREVAAQIRAHMRGSDVLSRYGGEEFAALLAKTEEEKVMEVAERVRSSIEARQFTVAGNKKFNVTISIGIAIFDAAGDPGTIRMKGDYLIGQADKALYQAKSNGRNKVISAGTVQVKEDW